VRTDFDVEAVAGGLVVVKFDSLLTEGPVRIEASSGHRGWTRFYRVVRVEVRVEANAEIASKVGVAAPLVMSDGCTAGRAMVQALVD
jgi:hypothetical protein